MYREMKLGREDESFGKGLKVQKWLSQVYQANQRKDSAAKAEVGQSAHIAEFW